MAFCPSARVAAQLTIKIAARGASYGGGTATGFCAVATTAIFLLNDKKDSTSTSQLYSLKTRDVNVGTSNTCASFHCKTTGCEAASSSRLHRKMTAIGQFSLLSQTQLNPSITTFVMALTGEKPLTTTEFAQLWEERKMGIRHPRFHQTLSPNRPGYFVDHEHEKSSSTHTRQHAVTKHLSETIFPVVYREDVINRLKHLQTTPWDLKHYLWRIYIAPWGPLGMSGCVPFSSIDEIEDNQRSGGRVPSTTQPQYNSHGESLIFFQGHHALADGASISAAMMDLVDEAQELQTEIKNYLSDRRRRARERAQSLWQRIYQICLGLWWFVSGSLYALAYQLSLYAYQLWEPDPWSIVKKHWQRGREGSNSAERNLSFAEVASVEQVKWVSEQLGGVTINDIFCACVTAALARQLDYHRKRLAVVSHDTPLPIVLSRDSHMNVAVPVHLKGGVILPGESVGNNIGAFVVRLPGEWDNLNREDRLMAVHNELAFIKKTPAAFLGHVAAKVFSYSSFLLPQEIISWMYSKAHARSVAVVSNNRSSPKRLHLGGRCVESLYGFVPLPPGVPVGIVVLSYAGSINLTLTAEPWAVPDADLFLSWILEEYIELLKASEIVNRRSQLESSVSANKVEVAI